MTRLLLAGVKIRRPRGWLAAALISTFIATLGCKPKGNPPVANPSPPISSPTNQPDAENNASPAELLAKVIAAYADATSYQDTGELYWEQLNGAQWVPVKVDFKTAMAKPDQLALQCRGAQVLFQDDQIQAKIVDPAAANYDNQVKVQKANAPFTMAALDADVELSGYIREPLLGGAPLPLLLLLQDPSIGKLLVADTAELLDNGEIDGQPYQRLQVEGLGGPRILWIQPQSSAIARVEFPATNEDKSLNEEGAQLGIRKVYADFSNAEFGTEINDEWFAFQLPNNAQEVRYFVLPPVDFELPTPLFAKEVGDFGFDAEVEGQAAATRQDLQGVHTVLIWFLRDEVSASLLAQVDQVFEKYGGNSKVRFCAISPEPSTVISKDLAAFLKTHDVDLPLYRDSQAAGRDVFEIPGAPCIVVLDDQSRVQAFRAGAHSDAKDRLPQLLDELLAGTNPAQMVREMIDTQYQQYAQELAVAQNAASGTVVDLTSTSIAPASKPTRLQVKTRWSTKEVKQPGNLLIVQGEEGAARILTHEMADDWRTVVELDADGQVVARHALPVPKDAAIAYLRTAVNHDGQRYYVGASRLGRQAFLFDADLKLLAKYPQQTQQHDGISDVALVQFSEDDDLQMCVGFWGLLGVHGVGLDGKRLWTNRVVAPVVSLTSTPPHELGGRQVLATTDKGEIVAINQFGREDPVRRVEGFAVMHLHTSVDAEQRKLPYLGVALQQGASPQGLALNEKFESQWDLPLPSGSHRNQIQWVTSTRLFAGDAVQWLFAGPDGSVGIVSDDVSFFDSFYYGKELTGIAANRFGDDAVLILSSQGNVSAFNLAIPAGAAEPAN